MNEQNKHAALTIAQQYPPAQYNLLVPMQTVTEIADIQKPVMNSVKISTDLNDGEIYEMEKAKDEWRDSKGYVHKATPAKYALTKKGLTKLMRAAGIDEELETIPANIEGLEADRFVVEDELKKLRQNAAELASIEAQLSDVKKYILPVDCPPGGQVICSDKAQDGDGAPEAHFLSSHSADTSPSL